MNASRSDARTITRSAITREAAPAGAGPSTRLILLRLALSWGVMRVALISDLHGNEVALEAVLAEIARSGVDRLVCLGDVATLGPRPGAVLARLRDLGCTCILGNHDDFLLDPQLIHTYTEAPIIVEAVDWCRAQLSPDELAFVRTFQPGLEVPLGGDAVLTLFHGSPRSHMEDLLATTPPDELDRFLDGKSTTVMAGGHTHIQ